MNMTLENPPWAAVAAYHSLLEALHQLTPGAAVQICPRLRELESADGCLSESDDGAPTLLKAASNELRAVLGLTLQDAPFPFGLKELRLVALYREGAKALRCEATSSVAKTSLGARDMGSFEVLVWIAASAAIIAVSTCLLPVLYLAQSTLL